MTFVRSVLVNDPNAVGPASDAYATYGLPADGAILVIRPDGYIGIITTLNDVQKIAEYLSGFLL